MNGQTITGIEFEEHPSKKRAKKSLLIGIWKGLKVSNKELESAKKDAFDFDIEKYIR